MIRKILGIYLLLNAVSHNFVNAFCPVCTIAVGAGVGFSRWLKIDDTIAGVWIGGLTVSLITWTLNWLRSKNKTFRYDKIIITLLYFGFVVVPLSWSNIIGHPSNRLWGIDKLILGMISGGGVFLLSGLAYQKLKERNNGKAHFPFEKVVFPVASLVIMSIVYFLITK